MFPKTVRTTPVITGTTALTVSTVQLGFRRYDTVIFDDSPDKRHAGKTLGGYVIDASSRRTATRDEAMDEHREALYAARTETPG